MSARMQGVPPVSAIVELTMPFTSVCDGFHLPARKEKFTLFSDHNGSLLRRQPGAHLPANMFAESPVPEEKDTPSFVYALQAVAYTWVCSVLLDWEGDLLDRKGDLLDWEGDLLDWEGDLLDWEGDLHDWEGKVTACCCWLQLDRS